MSILIHRDKIVYVKTDDHDGPAVVADVCFRWERNITLRMLDTDEYIRVRKDKIEIPLK